MNDDAIEALNDALAMAADAFSARFHVPAKVLVLDTDLWYKNSNKGWGFYAGANGDYALQNMSLHYRTEAAYSLPTLWHELVGVERATRNRIVGATDTLLKFIAEVRS